MHYEGNQRTKIPPSMLHSRLSKSLIIVPPFYFIKHLHVGLSLVAVPLLSTVLKPLEHFMPKFSLYILTAVLPTLFPWVPQYFLNNGISEGFPKLFTRLTHFSIIIAFEIFKCLEKKLFR